VGAQQLPQRMPPPGMMMGGPPVRPMMPPSKYTCRLYYLYLSIDVGYIVYM